MFFLSCVNISIGSLGNGDEMIHVQRIHVSHCSFVKTTNGARIKTWEVIFFFFFANVNSTKIWNMSLQGGYGFAKGIIFEQLTFESVVHPILIDQHYCTGLICPRKVLIRFVNHYHYFLKSASENYSNVLCFQLGTHKEIRSSCEWYSFHWTNRYELKPRSDHVELQ